MIERVDVDYHGLFQKDSSDTGAAGSVLSLKIKEERQLNTCDFIYQTAIKVKKKPKKETVRMRGEKKKEVL